MVNICDDMYASLWVFSKINLIKNKLVLLISGTGRAGRWPSGPVAPAWPVTHLLPARARGTQLPARVLSWGSLSEKTRTISLLLLNFI